jgi:hypothetical protein
MTPRDDSIATYLSDVFETNQFADITIKTKDGKEIKALKFILSRSPVFNAMLNLHDTKEAQNGVIKIEDIEHEVLLEMIRYMYTDQVPKLKELALELMIAANKYDLPKLFEMCKDHLKANITIENFVDALTYADNLAIEDLEDAIMKFIADNDDAVFASNEWKLLKKDNSELAMKVMEYCYKKLKKEPRKIEPQWYSFTSGNI